MAEYICDSEIISEDFDEDLSLDELRGVIHPILMSIEMRNLNLTEEIILPMRYERLKYLLERYKSKGGDIYFFLTGPGAPINFLSEYDNRFGLRELEIIIKPFIEKKNLTGGEEKIKNKYLKLFELKGGNPEYLISYYNTPVVESVNYSITGN